MASFCPRTPRGSTADLPWQNAAALADLDMVLATEPANVKALYRRGQVHLALATAAEQDDNQLAAALVGEHLMSAPRSFARGAALPSTTKG